MSSPAEEHFTPQGVIVIYGEKTYGPVSETEFDPDAAAEQLGVSFADVQHARMRARYEPVTFEDIGRILETTIKRDYGAKLVTLSNCLLAQTENDQFTVGFQADSSTGKSYVSLEVLAFFPPEEIIKLSNASPKSFYYDPQLGDSDPETHVRHIRLGYKILVFLDAPDYRLLENLRSFLAHDERRTKEYTVKVVNKQRSGRNQSETIILHGHAAVIFCTAGFKVDEQEKTRTLFVSPESSLLKVEGALDLLALKEQDEAGFNEWLDSQPERKWLISLIQHIRDSKVRRIIIPKTIPLSTMFKQTHPFRVSKDLRDFPRVCGLIKAHALLNIDHRERNEGGDLIATVEDVSAGFALYDTVREANDLGLSPAIYEMFVKIIKPILSQVDPLMNSEIKKRYYETYHRYVDDNKLSAIISQLETAGLMRVDNDCRPHQYFAPPDKMGKTEPAKGGLFPTASGGTPEAPS